MAPRVRDPTAGTYRRTRLFVLTLRYSRSPSVCRFGDRAPRSWRRYSFVGADRGVGRSQCRPSVRLAPVRCQGRRGARPPSSSAIVHQAARRAFRSKSTLQPAAVPLGTRTRARNLQERFSPCSLTEEGTAGGRTRWAHCRFTRINIAPITLRNQIEEVLDVSRNRPLRRSWCQIRSVGRVSGGLVKSPENLKRSPNGPRLVRMDQFALIVERDGSFRPASRYTRSHVLG